VDAIVSARHPHCFPSLTREGAPAVLATTGNPDCHLVLRGGTASGPNFSSTHVTHSVELLTAAQALPSVMIDCSHGNSGKKHDHQPAVAADVSAQVAAGSRAILGVMLESNLIGGAQKQEAGRTLTYGQSITDACLAFGETVPVLEKLAAAVATRRQRR
jgi:3-deoxy-7-phosphoheptulonate synthase